MKKRKNSSSRRAEIPLSSCASAFMVRPIYKLIYRIYRVASGLWYWSRRRFTPAGFCVAGAFLVTGSFGLDVENTVTHQAFSLLLAFLAMAFSISWFFRARFSVQRSAAAAGHGRSAAVVSGPDPKPDRQNANRPDVAGGYRRPAPVFSRLAGLTIGGKPPRPLLPVQPAAASQPVPDGDGQRTRSPARAATDGEGEVRLEVRPLRRGVLRFDGATLARTDPLGLFRAFVRVAAPQTMLILPKRYWLPPMALPGSMKYQEGGVALAANVGRSEEFVALRDYRRGDPLRHIHWRSWAKAGRPIVKEFEDEFFVRHALVLDTFTAEPHSEILEEAVSVAASFACTVLTQESLLDLLFVGTESYCFTAGRGLGREDRMLEILAGVRACRDKSFSGARTLVLSHVAAVSGCVCVLLRMG